MKKVLLLGILSSIAMVAAQAFVYCPNGPADCIKSSATGKVTCTLVGNNGNWKFRTGGLPIILPVADKDYFFPFVMAGSGIHGGGANCMYENTINNQWDQATFTSSTPLVNAMPGVNGWVPTSLGGYACQPTPGVCPFKPKV